MLSFTAEEIWAALPGEHGSSVMLSDWHAVPKASVDDVDWATLIAVRDAVSRELERAREAGTIGSSLAAEVDLYCDANPGKQLSTLGDELRFVFITSEARVHPLADKPDSAVCAGEDLDQLWISVSSSAHDKCERCWHRRGDVGTHAGHETLCGRCVSNVDGAGEQRIWA